MHYYIGMNSLTDLSYPGLLDVVYWVVEGRILSSKKINFQYYYDDYYIDDDGVIEWHDEEDHQKRRAQKASMK